MSSGNLFFAVGPGGGFVVKGACFEASVQDTDRSAGRRRSASLCSIPRARGAGNNRAVSTATASSFLNAGTAGGWLAWPEPVECR